MKLTRTKHNKKNIHYARMLVAASKIGLNTITDMLESNQLKVTIDSVFSLNDAKQAMIKCESARATGKTVIEMMAN